nr:cytochrome P450 1B1-like [Rhipicephalus microplus]
MEIHARHGWLQQIFTWETAWLLSALCLALFTFLRFVRSLAGRRQDDSKRLPPGPKGVPILGYIPFMRKPLHIIFHELSKQHGPIVRLRLGCKDVVALNDLESIREGLSNPDLLYRPGRFHLSLPGDKSALLGRYRDQPVRRIDKHCTKQHTLEFVYRCKRSRRPPETLQCEIDRAVGRNRSPEWKDRHSMPYTMASILETLRWRTLAPLSIHRAAGRDTVIGGYRIPAGTLVVPNLWSLHNDPAHWVDPSKYDPTRFLNADGTMVNEKPQAFAPFSLGRRACPGESLALMEIFLYVTIVLQKFKVLPEQGATLSLDVQLVLVAAPNDEQGLRFIPR